MARFVLKNTLRTQRFLHGEMTQQDLADRLGVSRQTVIAIEKSKYSPSLELAFQVAQVFGVSLTEIFSYEEEDK